MKTEDAYDDFVKEKKMLEKEMFQSKSLIIQANEWLVRAKAETMGVAIDEIAEFEPNMYSLLVDGSTEIKKAKDVNKILLQK